ncbi:MAG: 4Fe-4S binding protein [Anaerolineae bacterium]
MVARAERLEMRRLAVPLLVAVPFWVLGVVAWQASGYIEALINFAYIGTSVAVGLGLYAALPRRRKPLGRKLTLFLVGLYLLGLLGLVGGENIQIEGVFLSLLTGVSAAAVMHYFVAKVFGPLLFGRLWCGWACWTVMVLDLLPFGRSRGRLPGRWGYLRYAHFAASLALVLLLWYAFGYHYGGRVTALAWLIGGNLLYYAVGIGLAFALKDNRAFCKYVCPITLVLKATSRFSLLKVKGDAARCDNCGVCSRACPMDIRVDDYVAEGRRVLSTECTLCQTCVTVCPRQSLRLSVGLDVGGRELLRQRE